MLVPYVNLPSVTRLFFRCLTQKVFFYKISITTNSTSKGSVILTISVKKPFAKSCLILESKIFLKQLNVSKKSNV